MIKQKWLMVILVPMAYMAATATATWAQSNIDPVDKFAWSENCGWTNWRDADGAAEGVVVGATFLSGNIWAENAGWINVGDGSGPYGNTNGTDFGVNILAGGDLDGFAWGENIGWLNFGWAAPADPNRPRFDAGAGRFRGWVWAENAGWINLDDATHFVATAAVPCTTVADCADTDNDGKRDDPCLFYECIAGTCVESPRGTGSPGGQADIGGATGACPVDQVCDNNDKFHAQNCFGNLATTGLPPYPCETTPANPVYNVDAGGFAGTCVLDGTCDINDVFHADNCFANLDTDNLPPYPCQCGPGPSPQHSETPTRPDPVARTTLSLVAPRAVRGGQVIEIDVFIDDALAQLGGYQLHVGVSGGRRGSVEVVDFSIDEQRGDYVFREAQTPAWAVFNVQSLQLMNGLDLPILSTPQRAYVATITLQVSKHAAGTFEIDLLHDEVSVVPKYRTFLFATPYEPIGISETKPAIIEVESLR